MSRPRLELGPHVDAEIEARAARGESAETIFFAIGKVASTATIQRRMRPIRAAARLSPDDRPLSRVVALLEDALALVRAANNEGRKP